jgi:hypothetical protein
MASSPKIIVANPGGAASNTHEATTIAWAEGSYTTGKTVDGIPYVIAPNGIKFNEPSPAFTTAGRGARNGSMINPIHIGTAGSGPKQAFDGGGSGFDYDVSVAANFSAVHRPNDCLVKTDGLTTVLDSKNGLITKWSGIHVVSAAPATTAFAAPFLWPVADKANRPWRTVDLDARLAELPSYSAAGQNVATWASLQPYYDQFDLGRGISQGAFQGYELYSRHGSTPSNENYGRYLSNVQSQVLIGLMSAAWSAADKRAALIRLLQNGCQWGEAIVKAGYTIAPDGGHEFGTYVASMAWLWATGRQAEYATWLPKVAGNVLSQYYTITASNIANDFVPHSDPLKPYAYRRRNVTAVSGTAVTVQGFRPASGDTEDTSSNTTFNGLDLVKESGGNSAQIIGTVDVGGPPGTFDLTLAAPLTGLAVSDVVYCRARYTLTDGMAEWRFRDQLNLSNPTPDAPYRALNFPCAARMFCRAIGMVGSNMAIGEAYLERAMSGANGMPSQADNVYTWGGNPQWVKQFYDANWTTLKALPQDV